jgi:hypothetical protein
LKNLKLQDKDFMLSFITVFKVSINFITNNADLIPERNSSSGALMASSSPNVFTDARSGWFSDNWKCISGTAGMVIAGAAGGCYGGGQLGEMIGAIGGAAGILSGALTGCGLGAAIGGLAGGLIGAATFCSN